MSAAPFARTAFVVAHYDARGRVAAYLRELVAHLAAQSAPVVFVSTGLASDEAGRLAQHARVIVRENVGYDFGSYKAGIESLGDLAGIERLVLLNSSFLVADPAAFTARFFAASGRFDLLGLTQCGQIAPHLQSFCLCFDNPGILAAPAFASWWRAMTPISDKQELIRRYEVGLSAHFAAHGFRLGCAFGRDRRLKLLAAFRAIECGMLAVTVPATGPFVIDPEIGDTFDPTHFTWEALLEGFGVLKLSLLKINPAGVNLSRLPQVLAANPALRALLEDALAA
jgi:rhamnosyltransferase